MINLSLAKPKYAIFFLTYRCNSRCLMCHAWQKQSRDNELSIADVESFFSDKLFCGSLERINLTGGEPTMYPHLLDAVKILLERCARLKSIDMPTNGLDAPVVLERVETMLALLFKTEINLFLTVSLDGVGAVAEKVRNVPGAFEKADKTIRGLVELKNLYKTKLFVNLNATVSKENFDNLEELRRYASEKKIGINFTPAAISEIGVESLQRQKDFLMNQQQKDQVALFFEKLMQASEIALPYGNFVINWLKAKKRRAPCVFRQQKAVLIEPTGDVYLCGNFKEFWIGNMKELGFTKIWRNKKASAFHFPKVCSYCASNCYM